MANTTTRAGAPRLRAYGTAADGARTTFDCATDRSIPLVGGVTIICDDGPTRQRIVDTLALVGLIAVATRVRDHAALYVREAA